MTERIRAKYKMQHKSLRISHNNANKKPKIIENNEEDVVLIPDASIEEKNIDITDKNNFVECKQNIKEEEVFANTTVDENGKPPVDDAIKEESVNKENFADTIVRRIPGIEEEIVAGDDNAIIDEENFFKMNQCLVKNVNNTKETYFLEKQLQNARKEHKRKMTQIEMEIMESKARHEMQMVMLKAELKLKESELVS